MNKILIPLIILVLLSCSNQKELLVKDDWHGWQKTVNKVLDYRVPGHLDNKRVIYINADGTGYTEKTISGRSFVDFPDGTVIMKDIFAPDSDPSKDKPSMTTGMKKAPGSPDAVSGWIWVIKAPDGSETIVRNGFCQSCHEDANEIHNFGAGNPQRQFRDYVFFLPGTVFPGGEELPSSGY